IRLRDPWQCEPTPQGGLRWTRTFHRPTGLEEDDNLWLVLSGLPAEAEVQINGHAFAAAPQGATGVSPPTPGATGVPPVPESGTRPAPKASPLPASFNLTPILADKNQVEIHIPQNNSHLAPSASR